MATATGVGGLSCDFVGDPPNVLLCSVCSLPFRDPYLTDCCGAHFCMSCIYPLKNNKGPCPECEQAEFEVMIDRNKLKEVNELLVYCASRGKGCEWKGCLRELEQHQTVGCDCILVVCSLGCGERLPRKNMGEHEVDLCPKRTLEEQVKSLTKQLDAAIAKRLTLEDTVKNAKLKNKELSAKNKELKAANSNQTTIIREQQMRIDELAGMEKAKKELPDMKTQTEKPETEKTCPVCNTRFPGRMKQIDFENHVQLHFRS